MSESEQRVAVVTGAARGIGRAIAEQLCRDGCAALIADIRVEAAEAAAAEMCAAGWTAAACAVDVTDARACAAMIASAVARFSRVDVLVNNAGVSQPGPSLDVTPEDWTRLLAVHLNGAFFCAQAAGRQMVKQGHGGCIVNISSINAEAAFPQRAAYGSAKAGINQLTKTLAIEWAEYGIRVNAVGPAHTETEMTAGLVARGLYDLDTVKRRIPLGRLAQVQDVANAVSFLVSDKAGFITGHVLYVDGGYLAYGYW
jgi:3-oxoacyl-[acyl-carrier protein] reductase